MSYAVDFYEGGKKLASGRADESNIVTGVTPYEGRGLSYMRQIQIVVTEGPHAGASIVAQVRGDTGECVMLAEPMPFRERA